MNTRTTAIPASTDVIRADLAHHGDADLLPGLTDLAVNVRSCGTPGWLAALIRDTDLAACPDQRAADAIGARHGRANEEVPLAGQRTHLLTQLAKLLDVRVVPDSVASFVLLDTGIADVRIRLHARGFAVRRGETFPGLAPGWIHVAVRDIATSDRFALALQEVASHV